MKNIDKMKITEIKENEKNPRVIKGKKFDDLVRSVVTFPEMMALRPIVVDNDNVVLGGNMRLRALKHIKSHPIKVDRLIDDADADDERKEYLGKYWDDFLASGDVVVSRADELTEEQKREFVIKDNVAFGEWDWDVLANEWDNADLTSWGLDVWEPVDFEDNADDGTEEGGDNTPDKVSLADEDKENILYISYRQSQAKALAELLHVDVLGMSISADELLKQ